MSILITFAPQFAAGVDDCGASSANVATLLRRTSGLHYSQLSKNKKTMRVFLEPADLAGQRRIALGLQELGLAEMNEPESVSEDADSRETTVGSDRSSILPTLCFNFKRIRKKEVYQAFLNIYARGGIEMTNEQLISFLARHTNLGSEASITTLFYRYKQQIHL